MINEMPPLLRIMQKAARHIAEGEMVLRHRCDGTMECIVDGETTDMGQLTCKKGVTIDVGTTEIKEQ